MIVVVTTTAQQKRDVNMTDMTHNTGFIEDLMSEAPALLSCRQTEELLNVSRASVYRLMDTGELDRVRISLSTDGRPTTRITNESVRNLLISWSTKS
jgi:hypothetical protein